MMIHSALELWAARKVDEGVIAALISADKGRTKNSRNQKRLPSDDTAAINRPPQVASSGSSQSPVPSLTAH